MRRQLFFLIFTQSFFVYKISELDVFGGLDHRKYKATKIKRQKDAYLVAFIYFILFF
jgi:hypothetical protein